LREHAARLVPNRVTANMEPFCHRPFRPCVITKCTCTFCVTPAMAEPVGSTKQSNDRFMPGVHNGACNPTFLSSQKQPCMVIITGCGDISVW
jgi:hypothetical protein